MRHYILLFIFCCGCCFAQQDLEKDTIRLQTLRINKEEKLYNKKVKIKSDCYKTEDMYNTAEMVTLLENVSSGLLKSISFYFNTSGFPNYEENKDLFEATEFEVIIYEALPDNSPGAKIHTESFLINSDTKGKVEINLKDFNIEVSGRLFIGIKKKTPEDRRQFYFSCLCNYSDSKVSHTTLYRRQGENTWRKRVECGGIRMEVEISAFEK